QSKWLHSKYDVYGRPISTGFYVGSAPNPVAQYGYSTQLSQTTYDGSSPINKGKIYFHQNKVLGSSDWIKTIYYYDQYGRNYATSGNNALNQSMGKETAQTQFDFADNVLSHTRRHYDGSNALTKITTRADYDHKGRLSNNYHQINNEPEVRLANHVYNHRDFLMQKNLHYTGSGYLQNIDYGYNVQGWLVSINELCRPGPELPELPELDPPAMGLNSLELELNLNATDFQAAATALDLEMSVMVDVVLQDGEQAQRQSAKEVALSNLETENPKVESKESSGKAYSHQIQLDYPVLMLETAQIGELLLQIEEDVIDKLQEAGVSIHEIILANQLQNLIEKTIVIREAESSGRQAQPKGFTAPLPQASLMNNSIDLFSMELRYDQAQYTMNAPAQYNGNIAAVYWQVGCQNMQIYGYQYDYQDRLTRANYGEEDHQSGNFVHLNRYNVVGLRYDDRGNIDRLYRRGQRTPTTYSYIDRLFYDYTG
ncbi:MAG: hypothetical protein AAFV95_29190, partial [Bacteroidota bacterium]